MPVTALPIQKFPILRHSLDLVRERLETHVPMCSRAASLLVVPLICKCMNAAYNVNNAFSCSTESIKNCSWLIVNTEVTMSTNKIMHV